MNQPIVPLPYKVLAKFQNAMVTLEAQLRQAMAAHKIPGLAVSVVYDQKVLWARGFGFANVSSRVQVTPDTLFRIGNFLMIWEHVNYFPPLRVGFESIRSFDAAAAPGQRID